MEGGGRRVGVQGIWQERLYLALIASFEDGGRGHEPRHASGLQRLEMEGNS